MLVTIIFIIKANCKIIGNGSEISNIFDQSDTDNTKSTILYSD